MECIQNLIEGNHFESANFAIQTSKASLDASQLLINARTSIQKVREEIKIVKQKV